MTFRLGFALTMIAAIGLAQKPAPARVVPYDPAIEDRVSIDGYVDREETEYPASFADKASGMTVSWGYNDSLLFVALESRGRGWLAVGLGSDKMHESNMVIGYYCDDSADVFNQIGANYTHATVPDAESLLGDWEYEIDRDDETGITTLEFAYPLTFPPVKGLAVTALQPGSTYSAILAQNTKSISIAAKHNAKNVVTFQLEPKPQQAKPEPVPPDTVKPAPGPGGK